jgi:hypothetical protein
VDHREHALHERGVVLRDQRLHQGLDGGTDSCQDQSDDQYDEAGKAEPAHLLHLAGVDAGHAHDEQRKHRKRCVMDDRPCIGRD